MKIVIDKESIENVFAIAFYSIVGGDYTNVKETIKEILDKIDYTPYDSIATDHTSGDSQTPDKWIPITYRPMTEEERIEFAEYYGIEFCDTLEEKVFDCPMPEDGQEILISGSWGVTEDVADNDIAGEGFTTYGLEGNGDWDGVDAWMPKPEPYRKDGAE